MDGGDTWSWLNEPYWSRFVTDLAIDPIDTNTVYVTSLVGLTRTEDGGETWKTLVNAGYSYYISAVALNEANPDILFYAGERGISKSIDRGESFEHFETGLPTLDILNLYIDSENGLIYAGTRGQGIFVSSLEQANWSPINLGLKNKRINMLVGDKSDPSLVYAAIGGGGLYRSTLLQLEHELYLPMVAK